MTSVHGVVVGERECFNVLYPFSYHCCFFFLFSFKNPHIIYGSKGVHDERLLAMFPRVERVFSFNNKTVVMI